MGNKLGKLAGREAREGTIQSYIHADGRTGVLVEVDCNTDFVARNEDFVAFASDVALHVAASPQTRFVSEEEVTEEARETEVRVFEQQAADKPEHIRPRIVEGMLKKWIERGRPAQPDARQRGQARRRRRSSSCAATCRPRPARTSSSGASSASRSASERGAGTHIPAHPAQAVRRVADGRAGLRHRSRSACARWPSRSSRCTTAAWRSRSCSARATSTAASPARPRAWTARPPTTWGCWPSSSTRCSSRTRSRSSTSTRACSRRCTSPRWPSPTSAAARCATSRRGAS